MKKYLKIILWAAVLGAASFLIYDKMNREVEKETNTEIYDSVSLEAHNIYLNKDECIEIANLAEYCKGRQIKQFAGKNNVIIILFENDVILLILYDPVANKHFGRFFYLE